MNRSFSRDLRQGVGRWRPGELRLGPWVEVNARVGIAIHATHDPLRFSVLRRINVFTVGLHAFVSNRKYMRRAREYNMQDTHFITNIDVLEILRVVCWGGVIFEILASRKLQYDECLYMISLDSHIPVHWFISIAFSGTTIGSSSVLIAFRQQRK